MAKQYVTIAGFSKFYGLIPFEEGQVVYLRKEPENLQQFIEVLDRELKSNNSDYEAKRHKDIALRLPILHTVPAGTFNKWLKNNGKLGGQHKIPRLANERKYLEEILATANDA